MKIFSICWYFTPDIGAEHLVSYKLLNEISKKNDVDIVSIKTHDDHSKTVIDEKIYQTNYNLFELDYPQMDRKSKLLKRIFNKLKWYVFIVKCFVKKKYEVLHSRSTPFDSHIVALLLKKTIAKELKWVASFSDPWYRSPYSKQSKVKNIFMKFFEGLVLKNCDVIVLNNNHQKRFILESHKDFKEKDYKKIKVIPHSFVEDWYEIAKEAFTINRQNGKVYFVYLGSFDQIRNPLPFLNAVFRLKKELILNDQIQVEFYGNTPDYINDYLYEHELNEYVRCYEGVSYLKSLAIMSSSDFLLSFDANLEEMSYSPYLPSKIVDYLGANKLIIGLTMEDSPTREILESTNNYYINITDEESIYKLLLGIINNEVKDEIVEKEIGEFNVKNIAMKFCDLLT